MSCDLQNYVGEMSHVGLCSLLLGRMSAELQLGGSILAETLGADYRKGNGRMGEN